MTIKVKRLHPNARIEFGNNDSENAAMDLFATEVYETDDYIGYKLGFSTEFDRSLLVSIRPRSSVSKKDLIMCNAPGTIDANYRGEWEVRFKRFGPKVYNVGDAVAQVVITQNLIHDVEWEETDELSSSNRTGGFGSTGNN